MRLVKKPQFIMLACIPLLLIASGLGCAQGNSLERHSNQIASSKMFSASARMKVGSDTQKMEGVRRMPNGLTLTSDGYKIQVSEARGLLELDLKNQQYLQFPWPGKFAPMSGKLAPVSLVRCAPLMGVGPFRIAPKKEWQKIANKSGDLWRAKLSTPEGTIVYEYEFSSNGDLKRFASGEIEFLFDKFSAGPDNGETDPILAIPDGYVPLNGSPETMEAMVGAKFDPSRVGLPPSSGWSLYAFVDPTDSIYPKMNNWLARPRSKYTIRPVTLSHDPKQKSEFWKLVSATPTCLLVDKDGIIKGIWQGFDAAKSAELDANIEKAVAEPN